MASTKFVRDMARNLLKEFGATNAPVPMEEIIDWEALKIEKVEGADDYEGEIIPEKRIIRINKHKPLTIQRFTLAHELGHWRLFHQNRLLLMISEGHVLDFLMIWMMMVILI